MRGVLVGEDGFFHEMIAIPCGLRRYTMPLGVIHYNDLAWFRVFPGARLSTLLEKSSALVLLAPRDPLLFVESITHRLEKRLEWRGECPLLGSDVEGLVVYCGKPILENEINNIKYYSCKFFRVEGKGIGAYSRVYGCIVEFLIYYSRVVPGIITRDPGFENRMLECIERASRYGEQSRTRRIRMAVQGILESLQNAGTLEEAIL